MDKYSDLCRFILDNIGGKENISFATHCMTRLRLNLKNEAFANTNVLKNEKGILGCQFSGGQLQIIIGQHVDKVYKEFIQMTGLESQDKINENLDVPKDKLHWKKVPAKVLDTISGCITPLLPLMSAGGIFKLLAGVLGSQMLGVLPDDSSFLILCTFVGDAAFYFLPVFIAWSASKKFNTSTPIALLLATVLLHPTFVSMVGDQMAFNVYGIPATMVNYSSQFLPSLLIVWILSYVHRFFDKISPNSLRVLFVPTCTMFVMLPLALCILGPIGYYLGQALASGITWLYSVMGPVAGGLVGGLWFFLIATGMHQTLIAVALANIALLGFDNAILPESIAGTWAMYGMALAFLIRCAKEDKALAGTNTITFIFGGISEPTIFTTLLRYKQAMISYFIGGFVGGMMIVLLDVKLYFSAANNFLSFLGFSEGVFRGIICCVISAAISFIIAMILGFKEKQSETSIISPLAGKVIPLDQVKDEAFSSGNMGHGCAIIPSDGKVISPFKGEVAALFPTNHAIGLKRQDGLELLIHIGIDTVNENGEGFHAKVKAGDKIKKGQTLIVFDLKELQKKGYDCTVPIIITAGAMDTSLTNVAEVKAGEILFD